MSTQNIDLQFDLRLQRPGFTLQTAMALPLQGVTVLWGASGSGKTTLLRCLAGLERAHGRVQLGHTLWQDDAQGVFVPTWQRRLGMVFQDHALFDHLDVRGNLMYGLRRLPATEQATAKAALDEAVQVLGIGHLLTRGVQALSGGERQRVAMARALAVRPQVLLLDEPLAALDAARKAEVLPWLEQLRTQLRVPMVYVTHAADEVTRLADHLVVVQAGQVQASGPVQDVLASVQVPVSLGDDVGALVDATIVQRDAQWSLAHVRMQDAALCVPDRGLPEGTHLRLRILARDVSITLERAQGTSIQNHVPCVVQAMVPDSSDHQMLVQLRHGEALLVARVTRRAVDMLQLRESMAVWAQIKAVSMVH